MERYFLGGNSYGGFFSYYDKSIDQIDNVIMLKGGAGTGKSTLMKKVSKVAKGKGFDVEEWYCSGDPVSLDGVYVKDKNFAVVDATSPHLMDPKFPVVKDRIVNLVECLNKEKLVQFYDDIKKYANRKKQCYSYAYEQLNIALCKNMQIERLSKLVVDEKKLKQFAVHFADNILSDVGNNSSDKKMSERRLFSSAITPDGFVEFFDHLNGKKIFKVNGSDYASKVFLNEVEKLIDADIVVCNPLSPFDVDCIICGDVAIVKNAGQFENNVVDCVNLDIFENHSFNDEIAVAKNERDEQIKIACDYLSKARENHLAMEKIYVSAMNFDKLDKIRNKVIEDIFI